MREKACFLVAAALLLPAAEEAVPPHGGSPYRRTVASSTGKAVPNAVFIVSYEIGKFDDGVNFPDDPLRVECARAAADASGTFAIPEGSLRVPAGCLPQGWTQLTIKIEAPGFASACFAAWADRDFTPEDIAEFLPEPIVLAEGTCCRGRVTGPDGAPRAGARVRLRALGREKDLPDGHEIPVETAETNANGEFTLNVGGDVVVLAVTAPPFAQYVRRHRLDGAPLAIALAPGRSFAGTVLDHERLPVAGVNAILVTDAGMYEADTDGKGRFTFEGLATSSRATLWVFGDSVKTRRFSVDLASSSPTEFQAPIIPAVRLRLIDRDTKQPIAAREVEVGLTTVVVSDEQGVICFREPRDPYPPTFRYPAYSVTPRGYLSPWPYFPAPEKRAIRDLGVREFGKGPEVRVRVRDSLGAPVAGAIVTDKYSTSEHSVVTNAEGEAVLAGLSSRSTRIVAERDGRTAEGEVSVPYLSATANVEITFDGALPRAPGNAPPAAKRERVRRVSHRGASYDDSLVTPGAASEQPPHETPDGDAPPAGPKPCILRGVLFGPGGEIIDCRDEASRFYLHVYSPLATVIESAGFPTFTMDGTFSMKVAPCGQAWIRAYYENDAGRSAAVFLDLQEGAIIGGLSLKIQVPAGALVVVTTDEDGRPLEGAEVLVTTRGFKGTQQRSDSAGVAVLGLVPEEQVFVQARWPGGFGAFTEPFWKRDKHGSTAIAVRGETYVRLALADRDMSARAGKEALEVGMIRGTVEPGDAEAVVSLLRLTDPESSSGDDDEPETLAESPAPFRFENLVPRSYLLSAWSPAHTGSVRVDLASGETREVVIPLLEWGALEAKITLGGAPPEPAHWDLHLCGVPPQDLMGSGAEFQDDAVAPGTYAAELRRRLVADEDRAIRVERIRLPEPVIVPAGGRGAYACSIPAGSLTLALSLRGKQLEHGTIRAFVRGAEEPVADSSFTGGPVRLSAWPPDSYTLLVYGDGDVYLGMVGCRVEDGKDADLAIDLASQPEITIAVLMPDGKPAYGAHGRFSVDGGPCFRVWGHGRLSFRVPGGTLEGVVGAIDYGGFRVGAMKIERAGRNEATVRLQAGGIIAVATAGYIGPPVRAFSNDSPNAGIGVDLEDEQPLEGIAPLLSDADAACALQEGTTTVTRSPMLPPGSYRVVYPWRGRMRTTNVDVRLGKVTLIRP